MLDSREQDRIQKQFDVGASQVRRDHAISHTLEAIQHLGSELVFYGGTALSRTFLSSGRLSEDIDLFSEDRFALCQELDALPALIEMEFPDALWQKLPSKSKDAESLNLVCGQGIQIRIQVVDSRVRRWNRIPFEISEILQRFSDVPLTKMRVPTFDGFVAMKALAWFDRRKARDLFDLAALSQIHDVTPEARRLVKELLGHELSKKMIEGRVAGDWKLELAHQTRLHKSEEQCMTQVLEWWP